MTRKILALLIPLFFLTGNLRGQTTYTENSDTQFNAGSAYYTLISGGIGLDYYGRGQVTLPGSDEWFNSAWNYRQTLTINSANSASLTNYSVPVTPNTLVPITAGRMKNDGSDIRFTTSAVSGSAASLPYYIEIKTLNKTE